MRRSTVAALPRGKPQTATQRSPMRSQSNPIEEHLLRSTDDATALIWIDLTAA